MAVAEDTHDQLVERLRKLLLVTDAALSHLSLDALLDGLLARIREILAADTADFLLLDEETGELALGEGFAARIAAERRPLTIDDAEIPTPLREQGIESLLGAPLLAHDRVIGVIHVGTHERRRFGPEDVALLELAAERAALAIEHARLYEAERGSAERLRKLLLVTDVALSHLSLDALLDELLVRIREILAADTAAFLMLDEAAGELVARAAKGLEEEVERGVRIPLGRGFAGRIAADRRPVAIEDVDHVEVLNPLLREKGIKSLLGVPLVARERVIGVIHVGTLRHRRFGPDDVGLLERAAQRAALGVERALLYDEFRRLDQVRHRFVSVASHELRTPAAAVYGAAATLEGRAGKLPPEQVELLQTTLFEQSARLAGLIEQLLDLSKVDAQAVEINPEPFRVAERLDSIVRAFPDSTQVALQVPDDLEAEVDPVVLERVLTNLLVNAIRHGAPPIVLSAERRDGNLVLAVEDGGPGVPPDFHGQLFEQFTRRGSSTQPGSGLGLAIARSYARAHRGDLVYRDRPPAGARFEFLLPQTVPDGGPGLDQ